jgi:hypothetical protein
MVVDVVTVTKMDRICIRLRDLCFADRKLLYTLYFSYLIFAWHPTEVYRKQL